MKKNSLAISLAIGLMLAFSSSIKAENPKGSDSIVGRWELCMPDGKTSENPKVRQKVYAKNSYVVLEVDKEKNTTFVDFIGTISYVGDDKLTETPIYSNAMITDILSKDFEFFWKVEGDYLYLMGVKGNQFKEIWIRVSN
ncbi:MAG: hypothetical protein LBR34_10735 [Prevotella sp.]|jgi:hypothetical protein|nr:hypothetical protein [Prevotella sp.]